MRRLLGFSPHLDYGLNVREDAGGDHEGHHRAADEKGRRDGEGRQEVWVRVIIDLQLNRRHLQIIPII